MRYYSFHEFVGDHSRVTTLSEEDIRKEYYPYWKKRMIEKFGEEYYNEHYSFETCLEDWIMVSWAWEVKK